MNDRTTSAPPSPRRSWLPLAALLAGLLLAIQPLLYGHLPWRADGLLHVYRLVELERAVRHGVLFPRWLPDLGYGFGFPLFNYYAPLSYYLLLGPRLLGFAVPAALQIGYALALITLGLGLYLWARALFGTVAGLVAAFAAVYAPYLLYDALHRGVLAELWGLAFLALGLAALHAHVAQRSRRSFLWLALAYAALILTHNILALIGSALLFAYAVFLLAGPRAAEGGQSPIRLAAQPFLPLFLGLVLSAFFWLPALLERDLVQIEQLYGPANFFYGNNFLAPAGVVALPRAADPAQVNPSLDFGLGLPQLLLAAAAFVPGAAPASATGARRHRLLLALATLLLLFMALPASSFLWDRLPLLYFVQFPWRFLGPASLLLAVLAGAGAARLPLPPAGQLGAGLLLLAGFALPWLFPGDYPAGLALEPTGVIRFEAETGWLGTTSAGEYLPVQVETLPAPETLLPLYEAAAPHYLIPRMESSTLPAGAAILAADYALTGATIELETPAPFQAGFHWYYFPGWQLTIDGAAQPVAAAGPQGLLAAEIPPGRHTLVLSFGDTPVRRWSGYASIAGLLALLAAVLGQRPAAVTGRARPASTGVRPLAAVAALGLLLLLVKGALLDRYPNPFVRPAFDGQIVRGVQEPLQVAFGDELVLLGYDLGAQPAPASGVVEVTLYWRPQRPLAEDYSVAVHLLDELGRRYGQHDSFHPAGYPTSRWLPGEYARDVHRLPLLPGTPPGAYRLLVSVYDASSGRRLDVRSAAEPVPGAAYRLAEVAVGPAAVQPDPAELPFEHETAWSPNGAITLLGYAGPPATVDAGGLLPLTLFWQALAGTANDYRVALDLMTEGGERVAGMTWTPGRESYPTSAWTAGTIIREERALLVPAAAAGTGAALASGRYQVALALLDAEDKRLGEPLALGSVLVAAPSRMFDLPVTPLATPAQFGDLALLAGYELSAARLQPGAELTVDLYWQATGLTSTSYAVFVHLVGPDGAILAQRDQPPAAGNRPTTGWLPDEVIHDSYTLAVPAGAEPGVYRLRLGLYDPVTGRRLPVYAGLPTADHLFLPEQLEVVVDG
jgi:hypothetical protein